LAVTGIHRGSGDKNVRRMLRSGKFDTRSMDVAISGHRAGQERKREKKPLSPKAKKKH
jgi:hypothetical protein